MPICTTGAGGLLSLPKAPGSVFTIVADPRFCASDASHLVPCVDGSNVRWIRELVTGVWYEKTTNQLVFKSDGAGGWYFECDTGRNHVFTGFSAPSNVCLTGVIACRMTNTSGVVSAAPFDSQPGTAAEIRGNNNQTIQYVDGSANPTRTVLWVANQDHTIIVQATRTTGRLQAWLDGVAGTAVTGAAGNNPRVVSPRVGGSGAGETAGRLYAAAWYSGPSSPDIAALHSWAQSYL